MGVGETGRGPGQVEKEKPPGGFRRETVARSWHPAALPSPHCVRLTQVSVDRRPPPTKPAAAEAPPPARAPHRQRANEGMKERASRARFHLPSLQQTRVCACSLPRTVPRGALRPHALDLEAAHCSRESPGLHCFLLWADASGSGVRRARTVAILCRGDLLLHHKGKATGASEHVPGAPSGGWPCRSGGFEAPCSHVLSSQTYRRTVTKTHSKDTFQQVLPEGIWSQSGLSRATDPKGGVRFCTENFMRF